MGDAALIPFAYGDALFRGMIRDEPWFVAKDAASALGYRDAGNLVRMLDDDEADTHLVRIRSEDGTEQNREVLIINESGLYHAIFKSRRPEAKAFRKWVTSEVLPSLRRTGRYDMRGGNADPSAAMEMLNGLIAKVAQLEMVVNRLNGAGGMRGVKTVPYTPRFAGDAEVFDFVTECYGKHTCAHTSRMCVERFGWDRAPKRVTINNYFLRLDQERGHKARPHKQHRRYLTIIEGGKE